MEVVSFREIPDEKKASGMTIVAAADYKVTLLASSRTSEITEDIPECWIEKTEAFMGLPEIVVMKKTDVYKRQRRYRDRPGTGNP